MRKHFHPAVTPPTLESMLEYYFRREIVYRASNAKDRTVEREREREREREGKMENFSARLIEDRGKWIG